MTAPKISVLIPLYNRKHYIAQCIDSALNQTFTDFEIIVRDDGSTDGSADFVDERYAAEISSGKIKLCRNETNLGEFPTDNKLLREATGKYVMILHSDDLYLPHALQNMYEFAEYLSADVVHAGNFLQSPPVIDANTQFKVMCWENRIVDKIELVPNDSAQRFNLWADADIFIDAQYNIFNRQFLLDNEIFFDDVGGNQLFCLHWLMQAKICVKTPEIFYIRRDAPDSYTNDRTHLAKRAQKFIFGSVTVSKYFDKIFRSVDYFKDNEAAQYRAKAIFYNRTDSYELYHRKIYEHGITPELHNAVDSAIKECFGEYADYVTFLFHKSNCRNFNQDYNKIVSP